MEMQKTGPDTYTRTADNAQERIWAWYDIPSNRRISFGPGNSIMLFFTSFGKIAVTNSEGDSYVIEKECFFLKPMNVRYDIDTLSPAARLVVCNFHIYSHRYVKYFLKRLVSWKKTRQDEGDRSITYLETERHTSEFLTNLTDMLSEGQFNSNYCLLKLEELFIYLDTYYDKEKLGDVFSPLLGTDIDFINDVVSNYRTLKSVDELATRLKMSRITFNRHFIASFGISASKWLRNMRNSELLKMIVSSDQSFTEIAYNMGFSSSAYLTEYCRKNWGKTPTQLRIDGK